MYGNWFCTYCGYTETSNRYRGYLGAEGVECPDCHKWTLIPVNKLPQPIIKPDGYNLDPPFVPCFEGV
jgi:hypothetical protein